MTAPWLRALDAAALTVGFLALTVMFPSVPRQRAAEVKAAARKPIAFQADTLADVTYDDLAAAVWRLAFVERMEAGELDGQAWLLWVRGVEA